MQYGKVFPNRSGTFQNIPLAHIFVQLHSPVHAGFATKGCVALQESEHTL